MVTISEERTKLLLAGIHRAYNTQINDILLAAFTRALSKFVCGNTVELELEVCYSANYFLKQ